MNLIYQKAALSDLDLLTETRMEVLRAVFHLSEETDTSELEKASHDYYKESLEKYTHVAYLVFDQQEDRRVFAGAGGISFYQVMPTCDNPSGWKAYVMNMYTRPEYRKKGIAGKTLELLIDESLSRGITYISLDASEMGRPVYEKHGFMQMKDEMKWMHEIHP